MFLSLVFMLVIFLSNRGMRLRAQQAALLACRARPELSKAPVSEEQDEQRCYNLILLDASGSMQGREEATIAGANETIGTIRSASETLPNLMQYLTMVTFTSYGVNENYLKRLCETAPICEVRELKTGDYVPRGRTPLYDAIGGMLVEMSGIVPENSTALVTVITDGYENASVSFRSSDIRRMVAELEERGWVFTYIGANQDAILEAGKMGISNAMDFNASVDGIRNMFHRERSSRLDYYTRISSFSTQDDRGQAGKDYFKDHN